MFYSELDNKIMAAWAFYFRICKSENKYPMNAIEWRQQLTQLKQEILTDIKTMSEARII